MAIANTDIKFSDLQTEFGGVNPISLGEYYNGGLYVPSTGFIGLNSNIPSTNGSAIGSSNFIGATKTTTISYDIIGGGGAGGYGLEAGFASDRAGDGGTSILVFGVTVITATGGLGGLNAQPTLGDAGTPGESSVYGTGGAGGVDGSPADGSPGTGFGAGGGGGGGDAGGGPYNAPGGAGRGGGAGIRLTGTLFVTFGNTFNITIGGGGIRGGGDHPGGDGSQGLCRLIYNGVTRDITTTSVITIN